MKYGWEEGDLGVGEWRMEDHDYLGLSAFCGCECGCDEQEKAVTAGEIKIKMEYQGNRA